MRFNRQNGSKLDQYHLKLRYPFEKNPRVPHLWGLFERPRFWQQLSRSRPWEQVWTSDWPNLHVLRPTVHICIQWFTPENWRVYRKRAPAMHLEFSFKTNPETVRCLGSNLQIYEASLSQYLGTQDPYRKQTHLEALRIGTWSQNLNRICLPSTEQRLAQSSIAVGFWVTRPFRPDDGGKRSQS